MISIRKFLMPIALTIFILPSCATLQNFLSAPTDLENITAIREVLNSSAFRALTVLAKTTDHGIEGLLPDEVKPVLSTLKTLGLGDEIKKLDDQVGTASEIALLEGKGLMEDAIGELKISDAPAIILGGEDAATQVLRTAMYGAIKKRYGQRLDEEFADINELKHWDTAVSTYNLFAKNKIEGSLSDFIAARAVDAIFLGMGKEETEIRKNPSALNNPVVTKVFDYYRNNP